MSIIVGGCDVGSATGKALILRDGKIAAYTIIPATTKPEETARLAMDEAPSTRKSAPLINKANPMISNTYGNITAM